MLSWFAALLTWWSTVLGPGDVAPECLLLGALDATRAHAFTHGEPSLLAEVYSAHDLRERDEQVLSGYAERGLRLEGMAQHRSSCRVLASSADEVVLDVVDRLGPTRAVGDDQARELPADEPTRRTVTLDRTVDGWRVAASR